MRILFLDIDTLRPDHLSCYGYDRNTSPNIDKIAENGIRFENYYCSDAPCLPSRTALMSGKFGIHTGVVNHGGVAADIRPEGPNRDFMGRLFYESLPGMLTAKGLKTATISPFASRHGAWHFYAGFSEIHDTGKRGMESAEDITPVALRWIEDNAKDDRWFLHINYWDPHTPFRVPKEFGRPFKDKNLNTWINKDILEEHRRMAGPFKARELNMYDNQTDKDYPEALGEIKDIIDLKNVIDCYDTSIRYTDNHVGIILDGLKKQGVLDDTIIIISSDHGELFGELGIYTEHSVADQATCRIPLVIRWPGMKKKYVDKGLHYNIDLLPTIAEMIGFKSFRTSIFNKEQYPDWDGISFAQTIMNGNDKSREYLVLSQCAHVCQRSVRYSDYIYIKTYHDGFHLFPDDMLFNLKNDPYERHDLAKKKPDIIKQAKEKLESWHKEMISSMKGTIDPLQIVLEEGGPFHARGQLKKYSDYLKETGRGHFVNELKKRHPGEFE